MSDLRLLSPSGRGASFWPRIGQEVIVDFQEGDPDQPIIIGVVYNADQMPPYLGKGLDPKHTEDNRVCGVKSTASMFQVLSMSRNWLTSLSCMAR